jgi:hypothetical protein
MSLTFWRPEPAVLPAPLAKNMLFLRVIVAGRPALSSPRPHLQLPVPEVTVPFPTIRLLTRTADVLPGRDKPLQPFPTNVLLTT